MSHATDTAPKSRNAKMNWENTTNRKGKQITERKEQQLQPRQQRQRQNYVAYVYNKSWGDLASKSYGLTPTQATLLSLKCWVFLRFATLQNADRWLAPRPCPPAARQLLICWFVSFVTCYVSKICLSCCLFFPHCFVRCSMFGVVLSFLLVLHVYVWPISALDHLVLAVCLSRCFDVATSWGAKKHTFVQTCLCAAYTSDVDCSPETIEWGDQKKVDFLH